MAFVESIINRHSSSIRSITNKVSYTLVTIMFNLPLLNSMSRWIDSDVQIIHTIRIVIGSLITIDKIPIIAILFSNRNTIINLSIKPPYRLIRIGVSISNTTYSRTKDIFYLTKLINIHYLCMSFKRSWNLHLIYFILLSTFNGSIILLLLELEHSIIISYFSIIIILIAEAKEVTSEIESLRVNTTFKAIDILSIPLNGWATSTTTASFLIALNLIIYIIPSNGIS